MKNTCFLALSLSLACANVYALDNQPTTPLTTQGNIPTMQTQTANPEIQNPQEPLNDLTFLEQNRSKPGVVTLPDGLQYKVITQGTGPKPTLNDTVTVNYIGALVNGTVFDSSYKRGVPATFPVNGVIPGWTEALQLMNIGSTWELYIPATLAYGSRGVPPIIGPNATLVFKVELISIQK